MLSLMRPEDEHAFRADDPVARYWLHNCVGFDVRGLRNGGGVVDGIGIDEDGATVLEVRRRGLLGGTTHVPADRVESVDPWDESIVLLAQRGASRERAVAVTRDASLVGGTAARALAVFTATVVARFFELVSVAALALAALVRKHWPGTRERAAGIAATLATVGHAYAAEAARACRTQSDAMKAWREERRRTQWGDDAPLTRAGAEEDDARREEEESAWPRRRVGR